MKSSPRRDCALWGAKISVFVIKNVSKQQIKTNYVCFPGLCLYRGLSLASAVGGWQAALLSSEVCSVAVEELLATGKIRVNQHRYRRAGEILGVEGYLGVFASCRLEKGGFFSFYIPC